MYFSPAPVNEFLKIYPTQRKRKTEDEVRTMMF
jgi:hypothetical protein